MKLSSLKIKNVAAAGRLLGAALCAGVRKGSDCWLISERPGQARDNGYIFFLYMKEHHPEQEVYYLIDKQAEDSKKLSGYPESVIQFDSRKHYVSYCRSKVHISAHVNGCCPSEAIGASRRLKKRLGFKDVFIPHGVSYGISEFCLKKFTDIDLFICSGEPEYENVLANYGYAACEVAYTGFPRLDAWHGAAADPKQIVLMPTWRAYLAQDPNLQFEESAYFKAYQSLLDSPELDAVLRRKDARLVFYLHNEMQRFAKHFHTKSERIEVVYRDNRYDIQELLKASALLITDYSSVHFDFAYMNKPVLYFQFDREEFFRKQYEESGFDAQKDGFGPVCRTVPALCEALEELYTEGGKLNEKYYARMRAFYRLHDDQNCERVYRAICERVKHE